MSKTEY